jgi:hypothetical protein
MPGLGRIPPLDQTAPGGVVGQTNRGWQTARFGLGHSLRELGPDPPSGALTYAQVPLRRARGDAALVLGHEVDGLELFGQRQLRGVTLGARASRRLRTTMSEPAACVPGRP